MIDGSFQQPLRLLLRRQIGNFLDFVIGKLRRRRRLGLVLQLNTQGELIPSSSNRRRNRGSKKDQDERQAEDDQEALGASGAGHVSGRTGGGLAAHQVSAPFRA